MILPEEKEHLTAWYELRYPLGDVMEFPTLAAAQRIVRSDSLSEAMARRGEITLHEIRPAIPIDRWLDGPPMDREE